MATKLLLSDDSITIQKVVELVLAEEGFDIKATSNGEEALQAIAAFKPEIILADIEMPKLNGYQLCEKVKANPATSSIPVILLAGAFEPIDEELAKKVGAFGHIIKPFESHDLINKIADALGAKPAVKEPEKEAFIPAPEEEAVVVEEDLWASGGFGVQEEEEAEAQVEAETIEEPVAAVAEEEDIFAVPQPEPARPPEATTTPFAREAAQPAEPVTAAQITGAIEDAVTKHVIEALRGVNLREALMASLVPEMKAVVEKTVREAAPQIMNALIKEVAGEVASAIKKDIEKVIWETVPDLAASAIKKEIEAIKAEI